MKIKRARLYAIRYMLYALIGAGMLGGLGACEGGGEVDKEKLLTKQIEKLRQEKTKLVSQIEEAKIENRQLKEQIQRVLGLRAGVEIKELYGLERIKIHRYSGFYDKDEDGKKEKLIVYIQPIDKEGDIIKVPGSVDVELWDLSKEAGQAKLGQWHTGVDELKENWFSTLIGDNYRLMFDVADKVDDFSEPLTVKVSFVDYVTGRVFKEQRVIKP